jgi:hypothetical protein
MKKIKAKKQPRNLSIAQTVVKALTPSGVSAAAGAGIRCNFFSWNQV